MFFFSFSAQRGPRRTEPARPGLPRAHRPHPGRNLGLGRQSAARARSRLGLDLAQRISSVRLDPTAERPFRAVKTTAAAGALENPSHFGSSPLSLLAACLFSAAAETVTAEQPRARKTGASFGAVAGPLAGARAPQRVSTPPSSGLAAALSWPSPGASARFLLQRRRKSRCASSSSSAPVVVYPRRTARSFFSRSSPSPFFPIPTHGN